MPKGTLPSCYQMSLQPSIAGADWRQRVAGCISSFAHTIVYEHALHSSLMMLGVHMLTGAAVGAMVPQTGAAIPLAIFSHYTIDHLPHWNYLPRYKSVWEDTWRMALEPALTVPIFFALAWYFNWGAEIVVPAVAATLPDVIEGSQFFLKSKLLRLHTRWHHFGHWHARFWPSLPILLSLLALVVWLLPGVAR